MFRPILVFGSKVGVPYYFAGGCLCDVRPLVDRYMSEASYNLHTQLGDLCGSLGIDDSFWWLDCSRCELDGVFAALDCGT